MSAIAYAVDPKQYPEKVRRSKAAPSAFRVTTPKHAQKQNYLDDLAWECRRQKALCRTNAQIAADLGISESKVSEYLRQSVEAVRSEYVEEVRAMCHARLELVFEGHLEKAQRGDVRSGELVVKAVMAMARLHGAEAPVKLAGANGGPIEITLTDIAEAIEAARSNTVDVDAQPVAAGSEAGDRPRLQ